MSNFLGAGGNDRVDGGRGSDVYYWGPGDGHDFLGDNYELNVLQFEAGIESGMVRGPWYCILARSCIL